MTPCNETESLEEFVSSILEEEPSNQMFYGVVAKISEDCPRWSLFLMCDDSDGEKYCGGHYPLDITDMEDLLKTFSMFSNQKRKLIIHTKGYFSDYS